MADELDALIAIALEEVEGAEREESVAVLKGTDSIALEPDITQQVMNEAEVSEEKKLDVRTQLSKMRIPLKLKAAMFGNAIVRRILIFDPNRIIQEAVLSNPQLMMSEIEEFVRNPNVGTQLLRSISGRSAWMRSYKVKVNLVMNPKCPPDLSLKWLKFLNENEVKLLSKSRNIPQVLQVAAKKKLQEK